MRRKRCLGFYEGNNESEGSDEEQEEEEESVKTKRSKKKIEFDFGPRYGGENQQSDGRGSDETPDDNHVQLPYDGELISVWRVRIHYGKGLTPR